MIQSDVTTFTEFAKLLGKKSSWVTQLKKDGRLVLTDDGRQVRVPESMVLIESTRDPAAQHVTDRHAEARAQTATNTPPPGRENASSEKIGNTYQAARAVKERYLAMSAKRDYEISIGRLLEVADVESTIADAMTTLRTRLEILPDVLGPQMAGVSDEAKARAILAENIENALEDLARQFRNIAQPESNP
jgi:hypothetical protein